MEGKYIAAGLLFLVAFTLLFQSVKIHDGFGKMVFTQITMHVAALVLIGMAMLQAQYYFTSLHKPESFVNFQFANIVVYIGMMVVAWAVPKLASAWKARDWPDIIEENSETEFQDDVLYTDSNKSR